ncbi:MAG: transposase [Bacteroidota bacterium]
MYSSTKHHRRSICLKGYDYSLSGAYFVTVCTKNRSPLLGTIVNGEMRLSPIGEVSKKLWYEIPRHFLDVQLDEFVVMPNHIHGIVLLWGDPQRPSGRHVQLNIPTPQDYYSRISPKKKTLSVIIRTYKAAVTTWCRKSGFVDFQWQAGFFDHIIRSETSLNRIRSYIATNAERWQLDRENPEKTTNDQFDDWLRSALPLW